MVTSESMKTMNIMKGIFLVIVRRGMLFILSICAFGKTWTELWSISVSARHVFIEFTPTTPLHCDELSTSRPSVSRLFASLCSEHRTVSSSFPFFDLRSCSVHFPILVVETFELKFGLMVLRCSKKHFVLSTAFWCDVFPEN